AEAERARRRDESARLRETLGELTAREDAARREAEEARAQTKEAERAEAEALERALRELPEKEVKEAIVDEMRAAGLLRQAGESLVPTLQFLDAFAAIVHDEEARAGGAREGPVGDYAEGEGHHRREPLRSAFEMSRMDIPASLLRARSRHPKVRHMTEDDVVVYREDRAGSLRVVLILDRSGSMEENGRMEAGKRAALALHHAVKARNRRNRVDLLLMDTSVKPATLRQAWETTPRGFTNTGAALRLARAACREHKTGRTLVYLVTDGLPEAYTLDKEDVAGHPQKAMAYAKQEAKLLARERDLAGFVMLLLEPKDEMFVNAARELAEAAGGRVVPVDPQELAGKLLREFEGRPAVAAAPAA
ncbi:MAG TPA: VWA domain-containing protein, partial [Candidatus Thermoplasmatota archaeon]|nr:VWA domain-containing protein [Candidatus Thermoplasmatota archaeon]